MELLTQFSKSSSDILTIILSPRDKSFPLYRARSWRPCPPRMILSPSKATNTPPSQELNLCGNEWACLRERQEFVGGYKVMSMTKDFIALCQGRGSSTYLQSILKWCCEKRKFRAFFFHSTKGPATTEEVNKFASNGKVNNPRSDRIVKYGYI